MILKTVLLLALTHKGFGDNCEIIPYCNTCIDGQTCTECQIGYILNNILSGWMVCCPGNCTSCYRGLNNGHPSLVLCDNCKDGYFGETCQNWCGKFCVICDNNTGRCTECMPGTTGNDCENCLEGRYGDDCNTCPRNCKGNRCNIINGACYACKPGYYGRHCNLICPEHCESPSCLHTSGSCIGPCAKGWYGLNCQTPCSNHCKGSNCHKETGYCLEGCKEDQATLGNKFSIYGDHCNLTCPKCLDGTCLFDGTCSACPSGLTGKYCDIQCSVNCLSTTSANQTCDISGYCIHGCKDGYYNFKCNERCNEACLQDTCEQETGKCILGSKPGAKCKTGKPKNNLKVWLYFVL